MVANASPDMGVRVQAGTLRIPTGSTPANYWYEGIIDTASPGEALTVSTANPSNPRKDLVIAYIDKTVTPTTSVTNNSNNMLKLAVVAGTPASSPTDPNSSQINTAKGASTNPHIVLARIDVAAAATQVTNTNISDLRSLASITVDHLDLGPDGDFVAASQTRANSSYGDLSTVGPEATVTIGKNGKALVSITCGNMFDNTAGANAYMGFEISGANSAPATDDMSIHILATATNVPQIGTGATFLVEGLAAGVTTFKAKYRSNGADVATFANRRIAVEPR